MRVGIHYYIHARASAHRTKPGCHTGFDYFWTKQKKTKRRSNRTTKTRRVLFLFSVFQSSACSAASSLHIYFIQFRANRNEFWSKISNWSYTWFAFTRIAAIFTLILVMEMGQCIVNATTVDPITLQLLNFKRDANPHLIHHLFCGCIDFGALAWFAKIFFLSLIASFRCLFHLIH